MIDDVSSEDLMRAAIVIPIEWHADRFTTDPRLLVDGLEAVGCNARIVCVSGSRYPSGVPVEEISRTTMENPTWWRERKFTFALVFTWVHSFGAVVRAIAESGTFVIAKGDTDGLHGARAHPHRTLRSAIQMSENRVAAARNASFWLRRLALESEHTRHAEPFLTNLRSANATVIETAIGRQNLLDFLASTNASDLAPKIHVVPNPVAHAFTHASLENGKERLIYAAGRWEAPTKNARLLGRVLGRYLAQDPEARAVIAGTGADQFAGMAAAQQITSIGHVDRETLAANAARARICLITSQRESFHIAGHEALAVGATIVGTPIPVVESMTQRGRYGTMAASHGVRSVLAALQTEMSAWDDNQRVGQEIAMSWRAKLEPSTVASQLVELVE